MPEQERPYIIRDGNPLCRQCERLMSTITLYKPGIIPRQPKGKAYFCSTHGQFIVTDEQISSTHI